MTKKRAKKITLSLDKQIDKIVIDFLEKIHKILSKYFKGPVIEDLADVIDQILDISGQALEAVYKLTSKIIRENYKRVEPFKIENILDLTYQEDDKDLKDRITDYFNEVEKKESSIEKLDTKMNMLLTNEAKIIKNKVLKHKLGRVGNLLIIECEENDCRFECSEHAGEYAADENIALPPYHPSCCCKAYFLETDEDDNIDDLDIEVEEVII